MSVQVRRRREAASFLASFVGAQGELLVDTTNNRLQVHDGATAGGYPVAKLSEVLTNTRTSVADTNYAALSSDRTIAFTALTATRTVTLPAASAFPTGTQLLVVDETGLCSAVTTIALARSGSDLINGAASALIASAFGYLALESNGVGRWTIVDQAVVATAAAVTVAVRQTVMGGPAASGAPSFLPATSGSLTLTAQNVSATTPLVVTAAQGSGAAGALNAVVQFTVNPTWTLAPNATNYLCVNTASGVTGATALQPIYQFGGTVSTTTGQFTFDKQAMLGFLGNGTSAVATPLVFLGEAVTSAAAVTSTIAYAYNGTYVSPFTQNLPGAATAIAYGDNLGVPDDVTVTLELQCTTADANTGYAAGVVLTEGLGSYNGTFTFPIPRYKMTRNTSGFSTGSSVPFIVTNYSSGNDNNLTQTAWKYRLRVKRNW